MFVNSGITAAYLGSTSVSKIFLGDTLVWPLSITKYKLTPATSVTSGETYVLIAPNSKKIVGVDSSLYYINVPFNDYSTYVDELPAGAVIFVGKPDIYFEHLPSPLEDTLVPQKSGITTGSSSSVMPIGSGGIGLGYNSWNMPMAYAEKIGTTYMYKPVVNRYSAVDEFYYFFKIENVNYTMVESLWSSGDTEQRRIYCNGISATTTLEMDYFGQILADNNGTVFGGAGAEGDTNDYRCFYTSGRLYLDMYNKRASNAVTMNYIRRIETSNLEFTATYYDGTIVQASNLGVTQVPSLPICLNVRGQVVRRFTLKDNGVIIFDGLPAVRKSDGYIGLYDVLTETFCPAENQTNLYVTNF